MNGEAVREFVRGAQDAAYVETITRPGPRDAAGDIHRPLAEARAEAPVVPRTHGEIVGLGEFRKALKAFSERPAFAALSYEAVAETFGDAARFSNSIHRETIGLVWGHSVLTMDDPEHRVNRALVAQAFTRKAMERWEIESVGPVVHGLIDRFAADGSADLVRRFHTLFPVYVITELLELPKEDVPKFMSWAVETMTIFWDVEGAIRAAKLLAEYLTGVVEARRAAPGEDLLSLLSRAELDGERLSTEAIVSFARLLLPAGAETTYRSSSSLLFALLTNPDQLDAVRADPSLIPQAIEEGLRWEPPLSSVNRLCTVDTEVCGVAIPENAIVECGMSAANRDPARWDDPDRFDIHRKQRPHLAFAHGPHTCLGMHLARMETRVAVTALLDRLPGLRLDPDAEPPEIRGIGFRSPTALPVRFDP